MARKKYIRRRIVKQTTFGEEIPESFLEDFMALLAADEKRYKYVRFGITTDLRHEYDKRKLKDDICWSSMKVYYQTANPELPERFQRENRDNEHYINNNTSFFPESLYEERPTFYFYTMVGRRRKSANQMNKKDIRLGTVFSGIGAIEQALKRLGVKHTVEFACDNGERMIEYNHQEEFEKVRNMGSAKEKREYVDQLYNAKTKQTNYVQKSYLANYKVVDDNFYQDVMLLDGTDYEGKVDLFVGGSPCQSFSIAGARGGFEDTRGTLFFEYCRLVKECQPEVFIYENVYGVLTHDGGRTWQTMQNVFGELGYHYKWQILDARHYGIPQGRRRLFVVGFKNEEAYNRFEFPKEIDLKTCPLPTMQSMLEENLAIGSMQSVNGVLQAIDDKKGEPEERYYLSQKLIDYVLSPGTKNFMHHDAKTDLPIARALVKNMGNSYRASVNNYVHTHTEAGKGRLRHLTMREVHRLMGYPDDYNIVVSKAQAYKQAGNSIVVDVMMNVVKQIIEAQEW